MNEEDKKVEEVVAKLDGKRIVKKYAVISKIISVEVAVDLASGHEEYTQKTYKKICKYGGRTQQVFSSRNEAWEFMSNLEMYR